MNTQDKTLTIKSKISSPFIISKVLTAEDNEFKCMNCSKIFGYKHTLIRHINEQNTNYERVKCSICGNLQIPTRLNEHKDICLRSLLQYYVRDNFYNDSSLNIVRLIYFRTLSESPQE